MIILDNHSKHIEILLGGAVTTNQLHWTASYNALSAGCGINCIPCVTNVEEQGLTNNTTPVTIVFQPNTSTPSNTYSNEVQFISVYNADTVEANVVIRINDAVSPRIILSVALDVGTTLLYNAESGWNLYTISGGPPTPAPFTIGSGLTLTGGVLNLGGALTQDTFLDGGFDFNYGSISALNNYRVSVSSDIVLSAADGTGFGGLTLQSGANKGIWFNANSSEQTQFDLLPTALDITSTYASFVGMTYESATAGYAAAHATALSIMHRGYNDLRYAPISVVGTVTSISVTTANGISGTVATATTTPAITLTLGAITPTSVNGNTITSGSGTLTLSTFTLTVSGTTSVNGTFSGTSSGTNTGDQTITLTSEATGSGTGSFAVTLSNAAVIAKVLTGFVSGAGTVSATDSLLSAIQKINGNVAALTTGVSSVSGTSNRITTSPTTGAVVVDIASTYVGQTSITTLGTVATGTLSTGAIIGGVTMTLGSDASYDTYYRNSSGVLNRLANGTSGQVLTATTSSAPTWASPISSGNDYLPIYSNTLRFTPFITLSTSAGWVGSVWFMPYIVPHDHFVKNISFIVTTAVSGNWRLALYTDSVGAPHTLIEQSGAVSYTTTGTYTYTFTGGSGTGGSQQLLAANQLYWMAVQLDTNSTVLYVNQVLPLQLSASVQANGMRQTQAFGTFPTTATPTTNNSSFLLGLTPL